MSSVTAVPLQPLKKGSVAKLWIGLLVVVLLGIGLAWIGTAKQQVTEIANGVRYRVVETGEGPTATPADLVGLEFEIRKADGTVLDSTARSGQPLPVSVDSPFPGLHDVILQMREGGVYQVWAPAQVALGQALPPGAPVANDEILEFRLRVGSILEGMAAMQQMMGAAGGPGGPGGAPGGPGGPGGAPHGPAGPGGPEGAPGGPPTAGPGAGPAPAAPGAQVPPAQPQTAPGNRQ